VSISNFQNTSYVVLDRDGVINFDSKDYIKSPAEWEPIPGSVEAIAKLSAAGIKVFVASNQSGLGRGYFSLDTLNSIHEKMQTAVASAGGKITGIHFCPHGPDAGCDCRKPMPGLLREIEREHNISLAGCPFVGDSQRDLDAAIAAGCTPVLVRTGNGQSTEDAMQDTDSVEVFDNLLAFSVALLEAESAR